MKNTYPGSCLCQSVKFQIEGEFESFFLCHCKYCQKDTGSAHAANLFSTSATLTWVQGRDKVKTFNLPGTRHSKSFCTDCGAAVAGLQMDGALVVAPAGSLDVEVPLKPNGHIFCSSRAGWDKKLDGVKEFETFPN